MRNGVGGPRRRVPFGNLELSSESRCKSLCERKHLRLFCEIVVNDASHVKLQRLDPERQIGPARFDKGTSGAGPTTGSKARVASDGSISPVLRVFYVIIASISAMPSATRTWLMAGRIRQVVWLDRSGADPGARSPPAL